MAAVIPSSRRVWRRRTLHALAVFTLGVGAALWLGTAGFVGWISYRFEPREAPVSSPRVAGLADPVWIGRDTVGVPRIEARRREDLMRGLGWVMAEDRLAQMEGLRLLSQGRLAELAGDDALGMDILMRSLEFGSLAEKALEGLSVGALKDLEGLSAGINAYVSQAGPDASRLFNLAGWRPDPWSPVDSLRIQYLLAYALSLNMAEELTALMAWERLDASLLPWLFPVYPDEPLNHAGITPLKSLQVAPLQRPLVQRVPGTILAMGPLAASNNWALSPSKSTGKRSLLANDTHLLLSQPALWLPVNLSTPEGHLAGFALPGFPWLMAGTNGSVAWGVTMVMADTQDLFLERLVVQGDEWRYESPEGWLLADVSRQRFRSASGKEWEETLVRTRHGPLINRALAVGGHNPLQPPAPAVEYGLALATTLDSSPGDADAIRSLNMAANLDQAIAAAEGIGVSALNLLVASPEEIGWVVTGNFPQRGAGNGQFPQLGWTGEGDWQGVHPREELPRVRKPARGYLATANHRSIEPSAQPFPLSSSWYSPERVERIEEVLGGRPRHSLEDMLSLQLDQHDGVFRKWRARWLDSPDRAEALRRAIRQLSDDEQSAAAAVVNAMASWNGIMTPGSAGAAAWGVFESEAMRALFLDELGPEEGELWKAFTQISAIRYSALQDHLLVRDESPLWDDRATPETEDAVQIQARALAMAGQVLAEQFGDATWEWGQIHTYHWESALGQSSHHAPISQRGVLSWLATYFDRGPYPAGGSRHTVNVAGYSVGQSFDVWNVPAMRMMVDFSRREPLLLALAGGQRDDPTRRFYDEGRLLWLNRSWQEVPFGNERALQQYVFETQTLLPPE